jgi:DNA-binding NtrC family response regulator
MNPRRRRKTTLDAWLNSVITPIYFIDSRRRVRFYNQGCMKLTGWTGADVLGKVCDYHSEDVGADRFLGELCPPPSVFQGTGHTVAAFLTHKSGREVACVQECFPLMNEEGNVEGVLVAISPLEAPRKTPQPTSAQRWHAELASARQRLRKRYPRASLIAESSPMKRVAAQADLAIESAACVWLYGEHGSGLEHLARTIHYESAIQSRAFVPLECSKVSAVDLKRTWKRVVEMSDPREPFSSLQPGTVYVIDAERFPRDLQAELLQFLERQQDFSVDRRLRFIAASVSSPDELEGSDELLPEFLLQLSTLSIGVPALRDRLDDLPLLAQDILESLNRGADRQIEGFDEAVIEKFQRYQWPDNVSELTLVIQEARQRCDGILIMPEHLPFRFRAGYEAQREGPAATASFADLESYLEQVERDHILAALEQSRFNKSQAAELLGIPRAKLYRRLEALGIDADGETGG